MRASAAENRKTIFGGVFDWAWLLPVIPPKTEFAEKATLILFDKKTISDIMKILRGGPVTIRHINKFYRFGKSYPPEERGR